MKSSRSRVLVAQHPIGAGGTIAAQQPLFGQLGQQNCVELVGLRPDQARS